MNAATVPTPATAGRYLESMLAGQPQRDASPLTWLKALREEAVEHLGVLTLPTTRDEEWRFTDISLLSKISFTSALSASCLEVVDVAHFYIEEATTRLVFVDGIYAPQLSSTSKQSGMVVSNLSQAAATHATAIERHLGRHVPFAKDAFSAQNTAFLHDAAVVIIQRDVSVAAPVHLLFIATQKEVVSTPRCLVLAETGSAVTVIEDYVVLSQADSQEEVHFTNAVTEIVLEDNAHVNHIRVQREGSKAFHIANCAVSLGRASNYQSVSVALGSRISRYNLHVLQTAKGGHCTLDGLTLISGRQLADTHTCIDHAKPHGISHQLHKCIVGGSAHAVFNGKVMVREGAQRADAKQSNRNLLLTDKAHIDTKPQLEIFASDVKCTHGATIGQLDSEEVFYLQSRGLTESAARNLLTYAFGAEIIDRIPIASLKQQLEQTVLEQTTGQP
ncbi:MAG: Fe-S cluster assembly protein SufD [Methylophilaceae bacterium]|jgi:Fe-S cluster assembly protein SufD